MTEKFSGRPKDMVEAPSKFSWDGIPVFFSKVATGYDDYGGKRPDLKEAAIIVTALVQREEGVATETRAFRTGKKAGLKPSLDGINPIEDGEGTTFCGGKGLSPTSGAGYLVTSLSQSGVEDEKFDDFSKLAPGWYFCKQKMREGMKQPDGTIGAPTPYTVVTKVLDKPAFEVKGASKSGNGKVASPSTTTASKAAIRLATKTITKLIEESEDGIKLAQISSKVYEAVDDDADEKEEINLLIADKDWLKSEDRPWQVKGGVFTLREEEA